MTPAELRALLEKHNTPRETWAEAEIHLRILENALVNAAPALSACVDALQSIHDNPDGARETARAALRALEAA